LRDHRGKDRYKHTTDDDFELKDYIKVVELNSSINKLDYILEDIQYRQAFHMLKEYSAEEYKEIVPLQTQQNRLQTESPALNLSGVEIEFPIDQFPSHSSQINSEDRVKDKMQKYARND
jgi:hypothetical protein